MLMKAPTKVTMDGQEDQDSKAVSQEAYLLHLERGPSQPIDPQIPPVHSSRTPTQVCFQNVDHDYSESTCDIDMDREEDVKTISEDIPDFDIGNYDNDLYDEDATASRLTDQRGDVPFGEREGHADSDSVNLSSTLRTECRRSHSSLLVVQCQLAYSPFCPTTAFSVLWPQAMMTTAIDQPRRIDDRNGRKVSGQRRRHTLGPVTAEADITQFRELRDKFLGQDSHDEPHRLQNPSRSRSFSESELPNLLLWQMGQELRRLSDEFNFLYSGKHLTPVIESGDSEDSDDEM